MADNPEYREPVMPEQESVDPSDVEELTDNRPASSRRTFLGNTARKAAYAAPLVLLFRPKGAIAASGGSDVTGA